MSNYAFFTESTIDCYPELIKEMECTVLPLTYNLDGKEYKNGVIVYKGSWKKDKREDEQKQCRVGSR